MTSSEDTDKREAWSEKSRRSKPVRTLQNLMKFCFEFICIRTFFFLIPCRAVCCHRSYLALFWQTAAAFAGGVIQRQTGPLLRLHMATQRTEQETQEIMKTTWKNEFMKVLLVFFLCDRPCSGCCPVFGTVDGPPPSCPPCISVLGLNWQIKPGEDEFNKTQDYSVNSFNMRI